MRLLVLLLLLLLPTLSNAQSDRILRQPDIHGDQVVFVKAGDIYRSSINGGMATQLTSHDGLELFPKFSPDGSQIAFSAQYNGTRQVYVMPTAGGQPKQLTWYNDVGPMPPRGGWDYRVLDWSRDGENVLVRANRLPWGERMGQYYHVPVDGGMEVSLSIPEGGGGMYSPDGNQIVYTPIDREFRTWKRYRGGRAQDVWTYDLARNTSQRLTTHDATDHQPMWVGEHIYFVSDRDYTLNLYRYAPEGGSQAVTSHDDFDILWPSAGPNAIVYENGGYLYRFDPATGDSKQLEITIPGDRAGLMSRIVEASDNIESAGISPDGKRVAFGARGEVFTVPAENGPIRRVVHAPASREIAVSWSPDGKWLAYLSDQSGEYEIYLVAQDGASPPRQLTDNGTIWRFAPVWSPDSSRLAFGDKNQQLNIVDADSGRVRIADRSSENDITDYAWAPDSRHLAYTKFNDAGFGNIWITDDGDEPRMVTNSDSFDINPVFDPEGRFLYFLSARDFGLDFSTVEFDYHVTDSTRIYAVLLNEEVEPFHRPDSDEVTIGDPEKEDDDEDEKVSPPFRIDFEGINDRVIAVNDAGGDFRNLNANKSGVFYMTGEGDEAMLKHFDIESEEASTILTGLADYGISANGEKVLFRAGSDWGIAKAEADQDLSEGRLDLDNMELRIDPALEWRQMYTDAWRIMRDWFYDPGMHGNDWEAIHDKYLPLVDHVTHRADLDYILSEIAGEMNAGHIYVQNGDEPGPERRESGLLGAEFERDGDAYRITNIFDGEPWHDDFRSPLAEPGVDVETGDYLLAVNGRKASDVANVYELLENTGGDLVTLTINSRPRMAGARNIMVKTIASETNLRYLDWVESRRRMVDELSDGRIGYLHLPNTAVAGNRELFKRYLPQVNKDAILIDVRYNGGGFIPDRMIELVSRKPLNYWKRRGLDPQATPVVSHDGPKAVLINGYSSSGGDAFPYYFRKLGLGPLIGTRTWGGLIGISGNPMLADGGGLLASTFRFMDTDGNWAVENEGVAPDIEVIDRPELIARGEDPTLERGVQYLLDQLESNPPIEVQAPPAPTEF